MRLYLLTIFSLFLGTAAVAQTTSYKNISAHQADTLIRNHMASSDLVILDVRTSAEFSFERIDKSMNLDVIAVTAFNDSIDRLDRNKVYLVYCATGTRSPGASTKLQNKNFRNVYNLQGGISAWKREGYAIVKGIGSGIYPNSIDNLLVKIYPNPVVDLSTLEVDGFLEGEVKIEILNALGSLVLSQKMVPGRAISLNGRELSPGLYFYRLILPQNQVKSGRFQVAR
jgi:rhodanese-related sulfurtransferase